MGVGYSKESTINKEYLEKFATKEDLEKFATKEDLEKFATKEDLEKFATKEDLAKEVKTFVDCVSEVKQSFNELKTSVENLEIKMVELTESTRQENLRVNETMIKLYNKYRFIDLQHKNRNQALSMLTLDELKHVNRFKIEQDACSEFPVYCLKGGCTNASSEAHTFFTNAHSLMRVRKIEGAILIHPLGRPLTYSDGQIPTDESSKTLEVVDGMHCYFYDEGLSVWRASHFSPDDIGKYGQRHALVFIHTDNNTEEVGVDWSIGQFLFSDLSGVRLYIPYSLSKLYLGE